MRNRVWKAAGTIAVAVGAAAAVAPPANAEITVARLFDAPITVHTQPDLTSPIIDEAPVGNQFTVICNTWNTPQQKSMYLGNLWGGATGWIDSNHIEYWVKGGDHIPQCN